MPYKLSALLGLLSFNAVSNAIPINSNQSLHWKDCPTALGVPTDPGLLKDLGVLKALGGPLTSPMRCAYLDVPMDWDNPDAPDKITLGITKLTARDPEVRTKCLVTIAM